jgi:hypothetical protein
MATMDITRKLTNAKLERKKDTYWHNSRKNTQRTVQSKGLADFLCLLLDSDSVSYCNICRNH